MRSDPALPPGVGVGFKPEHFTAIAADPGPLAFIEVHAENYMGAGGLFHAQLEALRRDLALSVHGVGLNIGGLDPLDGAHLRRLQALCERYAPEQVSEHLAWSSHGGVFLNDLLPLPLTPHRLDVVSAHVDEVQQMLGRRILLENPATYLRFVDSSLPETDFLAEVAQRTGCGLLLDLNNLYVSSVNHGFDAGTALRRFPLELVGEIHLAGHAVAPDEKAEPLLIDAHGSAVADPVWALFADAIARGGARPSLIEWDNDVPSWPVLRAEADAAARILDGARRVAA